MFLLFIKKLKLLISYNCEVYSENFIENGCIWDILQVDQVHAAVSAHLDKHYFAKRFTVEVELPVWFSRISSLHGKILISQLRAWIRQILSIKRLCGKIESANLLGNLYILVYLVKLMSIQNDNWIVNYL